MKTIIVVGGGAGGLELVTRLGHKLGKKKRARIILVDRNRSHIWKPLLHEVATGSLDMSSDGVVYRAHCAAHYYEFQLGTMIGLDRVAKSIRLESLKDDEGKEVLPERELTFDTLVMAVGSVSNDFGTPGVAEHSYFLDSHQQAERFHRALLNQFMRINQSAADTELQLAIVGGGATGVELAAELNHVADLFKFYGMPEMSAKRLKIHLIEAGPRILPALPQRIAVAAKKELNELGITIHENVRVTQATDDGFMTQDDQLIAADLQVWAAGVKAPDFIKSIDLFETNRNGQIIVKPSLQSTVDDAVFVIGDCCACEQPDGSWVPPRAQSAHQMAGLVYKNILLMEQGKPLQSYLYKDHGSLVNLSRYSTVGSLMGNLTNGTMFVEGHIARLVYISLYRMHQVAIHGWLKAAAIYFAQKIGGTVKPKMKLH
ncbi:NAD(P)/FAD-dependent oxidoreductase [Amphritea sp. 2_MG-2023]|jgi:NADH dehydrogenase|uniref:NAD(P)/FAD-dependent oxidoreductase n=1 Tax=Amphritea TaxID=515417 RepID=UPI001C069190|nr:MULTISPECIES: NAD(P)/FAD-dependent oxidoreductase [Amphritea]MBU2964482.1 NAD(P)/FAD-dependent oxidoreductase [Amphritea atlantica]MDO6417810.1 NAD(P)/FAD-dependent oxidoreductase [Amphritea sp. 2_MG-2023]